MWLGSCERPLVFTCSDVEVVEEKDQVERPLGLQMPRLCLLHSISSSSVVSAFTACWVSCLSLVGGDTSLFLQVPTSTGETLSRIIEYL